MHKDKVYQVAQGLSDMGLEIDAARLLDNPTEENAKKAVEHAMNRHPKYKQDGMRLLRLL